MSNKTKTVYVGLSGGVDSAVSAALLKDQGYDVVGVHLVCFDETSEYCTSSEDKLEAERVASFLGISFEVWDLKEEYKKKVFDYMISGYKKGITPNPDVMCNKEIKFGVFYNRAMEMGADFVATGHYARKVELPDGIFALKEAVDKEKDQSYFLWTLDSDVLKNCLFPVGEYEKSEVRKLARKYKLPNAERKDSQGLCFVGKIDFQEFIKDYIKTKEGDVVDIDGDVVGKHKGALYYTNGQRKGLGVFGGGEPYYVVDRDLKKNVVVVAKEGDVDKYKIDRVEVFDVRLNTDLPRDVLVRIRYRQKLSEAKVYKNNNRFYLEFNEPMSYVSIGQSAVFYDKERVVLGGGIMGSF